jgi:hypothetical protein
MMSEHKEHSAMHTHRQQQHEDEERRYFAEWAVRSIESGPEIEANRNSYLAGGYSEEFGYHAQPGCSRGVRLIEDEFPEEHREWYFHRCATHPGYPERPNPIACDLERVLEAALSNVPLTQSSIGAGAEANHDHGGIKLVSSSNNRTQSIAHRWRRYWLKSKAAIFAALRSYIVLAALFVIAACKPPSQPESPTNQPREVPKPQSVSHQELLWIQ